MTLNQKLIRAIVIPEEQWQKIDKAEEVVDNFALSLLDFITNEKSRFSILYGDQEKRFSEFTEDKEDVVEYTKEELLTIFKKHYEQHI